MRPTLLFVILALLLAARCSGTADGVLWQIGRADNTYADLAIPGEFARYPELFAGGARFEVGQSDPVRGWPYVHPGPEDAWAGSKAHSHEIVFSVEDTPAELYVLEIDLVDCHAQYPPVLDVRVSEMKRSFELSPGTGDGSLFDPAKGREQVLRMYIRGSALRHGRNSAVLSTASGSWLLYDCITMRTCSDPPSAVSDLSLRSSFLFRKRGSELKQVICASMDLREQCGSVRVEVAGERGWRAEQVFEDVPAGRRDLQVEVPPIEAEQRARVTVTLNGEAFEAEGTVAPAKHWRIYLMPSSHFDIGYTSIQDKAIQVHRDNLEHAIDWCGKHPGFIWNNESAFIAEDYLAEGSRPGDFLALAKSGRLGVQGFYCNQLTGICSGEELVRLVDFYGHLRREHGIESKCAMQNDVPSMIATIPMVLAGHGIKYLSHGINATRARPDQHLYDTPHYWESPDGSRVLMWKTPGYGQCSQITGVGDGRSVETMARHVHDLLSRYSGRADYPFDALLLHGAYSDNQPNRASLPALVEEWNRTYEYPKLIFTRGAEFFEYIEQNFAEHLKTVKGDGGVWWEDGAASSARETAITRAAKEKLIAAEKLAVLCGPDFGRTTAPTFAEAWKNALLYDEHTWGAAGSISEPNSTETLGQWAVKKGFAERACELAAELLGASMAEFCKRIESGPDEVVVFNPSSWPRSEWVLDLDSPRSAFTGSVPPMGYRVIRSSDSPEGRVTSGGILRNRFYTIRFDRTTGAVTGIYDNELKRELVDPSLYGLNQYLYVTGGDGSRLLHFDPAGPAPDLKIETTSSPEFTAVEIPGSQVMRIICRAPMAASLIVHVILHDDVKRIDFCTRMQKTANLAKEAGYFVFPFAFASPEMRIEIPGGVIRPDIDQIPAGCRDWYAVQQFLTISDGSAAVAWSPVEAPLVTLQDINRGQWRERLKIENGHIYAYAFNNYWFTNYKASQDGPLTFRFSITSDARIDDARAKRFGESVHSPLVCKWGGEGRGASGGVSRSFVEIGGENVVLQAMKPARFAEGTVIRLREMAGRTGPARLTLRGIAFKRAYLSNLAEDKLHELPARGGRIEVPCRALGLTTVLLER